jgi:glycosyltransferase involved in cell wall biosynthesis
MRVALVHDWLVAMRGGEKCLERIIELFPDAHLYTLFHKPGATSSSIDAVPIHASALSKVPGARRHYRKLLPLFPLAIQQFDLSRYDLVISTSHAVAKAVRTRPAQPHLCYCFTPMRYIWDQAEAYLGTGIRRAFASPLVHTLRRFDRSTSSPDRVTRFVAISTCVQDRIQQHYDRTAPIVFPPVELDRFPLSSAEREDFYVMVGGFVPYKQESLAIEAFRGTKRRLVIVGDGPSRRRLAANAPPNVTLPGRVSDEELGDILSRGRALIYPQLEDFGLTALEAQACGTPVIAFKAGGALDTVRDAGQADDTGVFFDDPSPSGLRRGLEEFEARSNQFDPVAIHRHASRFGVARFKGEFLDEIGQAIGDATRPA